MNNATTGSSQGAGKIIALGAGMMAAGIALGAFGAHALKDVLDQHGKEIYEKAVFYHLINSLGVISIGILPTVGILSRTLALRAASVITAGVVLFSGSLYIYAVTRVTAFAMVTPFGGVSLMAGWILLCVGCFRSGQADTA